MLDALALCCLLSLFQGARALPLYHRIGPVSAQHWAAGRLEDTGLGVGYNDVGRPDANELQRYPGHQCLHMSQPWSSGHRKLAALEDGAPFRVRVHTAASGPPRPVFPHQHLFHYIKRIYSCCKMGFTCRKIKGLQGRVVLDGPLTDLEFYMDPQTLELSVQRAELHLEVSNPDRVTVMPVLKIPGFSSSSHTKLTRDDVLDLTLDVMFLFDMLREDPEMMSKERAELTLNLHCIQDSLLVPCEYHGVSILRAPFIALLYK
ncbi:hypothetical protein NDU88_005879 [Pleurodeles waltl]|uniref:Uncharacterized protein n=1 Tax=Pleurodeles waltl TaxID=8319 RepID=A0AAV7LP41_PLEWA|nr:hypothetical protein NDU88_005879 [Pleurodeles waltl]